MATAIFDCHADTPLELWRKGSRLAENDGHISLQKTVNFAHYAQFFAYCSYSAGESFSGRRFSAQELYTLPKRYMDAQLQENAAHIRLCGSVKELELAWEQNKAAAFYSLEGAESIDCDRGRLPELYADGVRMVSLTWNADNALAGTHGSERGLTETGRLFVQQAQELGMILDVSHCSDRSFFDILKVTAAPIVASHSNSRRLCAHSRNLTDEMFLALSQSGGVAGINLYSEFLKENGAGLSDVLAHIDHFLQLAGDEHVALGGDLDGCDRLPLGFRDVEDYAVLQEELLKRYGRQTVERICYRNILRVLEQCQSMGDLCVCDGRKKNDLEY